MATSEVPVRKMDACGKVSKILLIGFNLLILCGSLVALSIGIYSVVQVNNLKSTVILGSQVYKTAAYLLIISGAVTLLVSFCGCVGALRENKCMLIMFFVALFIIFILLFVGGILGYVYRTEASQSIREQMERSLLEQYGVEVRSGTQGAEDVVNVAVTDTWEFMQSHFSCCGVANFTAPPDWRLWGSSAWCRQGSGEEPPPGNLPLPGPSPPGAACVPASCCAAGGESDNYCTEGEIYPHGCYYEVYNFLSGYAAIIGGIGIGISFIPIIGMILVMIEYRQID